MLVLWVCTCKHINRGPSHEVCGNCGTPRRERHALPHASSRAVVYRNPRTGELRFPARADQPVPAVYARQGYEREEITNMLQFEKSSGRVHEASSYGNNGGAERDVCAPALDAPQPKGLDQPA